MISKISADRSAHGGKLMAYLAGPGRSNEHTNQRTVGGSVMYHEPLTGKLAWAVAGDLQAYQDLHPDVQFKGGHIYHVSLAIGADEQPLSDTRWRGIAEDFMQEMGFTGPNKADVRWTAVHHGTSTEGNDHIHVVASLIRADGTKISLWNDMPKSQKVVLKLEQKYGLRVLQSRLAKVGAGSVPYSAAEISRSSRTGLPVERVDLERRVRAAATTSQSEAEFVRLARTDGLLLRPYPPHGAITGYSAGLPALPGEKQLMFSGFKLARDLSLPRLRGLWPDNGGSAAAAASEWRGTAATPSAAQPLPSVEEATDALDVLAERLQDGTPVEFAEASGELSGALAAASVVLEGDRPGELAQASRQVGAWSGTRRDNRAGHRGSSAGRSVGPLLLQAAMDPLGPIGQAVMRRQLMELLLALNDLHRANRPMVMSTGRGTTMHGDPDGIDDAAEGLTTTVITLSAAGAAQFARNRAREREEGKVAEKSGLLSRFRWTQPDRPHEFGERDPLPRGLEGVISRDEWLGMDDTQRHQVDPDNVGRWATDYWPSSPGASLPSTADQLHRLDVLGAELGQPVSGAADLSRGAAAERLKAMEAKLGPEVTRATYLESGLAYREEYRTLDDIKEYRFSYPGDEVIEAASEEIAAIDAVYDREAAERKPKSPLDWKTAGDPVRPPQRWTLLKIGFTTDEVAKLDKGHASLVIDANIKEGPAFARAAYEEAVAQQVVAAPVVDPAKPAVAPPKPVVPPNRGHRM